MRIALHTLLLAWLLAALAACSSTGTDSMGSGSSSYGSSSGASSGTSGTARPDAMPSAQGTPGSTGMATGAMKDDETGMTPTTSGMMESAVVTSIEAVRGSNAASGTGTTSQGTSGTAGASGSGQMYRITLRMDDGSSRVLMQDWAPGFKSGDRVTVQNGAIQMKH